MLDDCFRLPIHLCARGENPLQIDSASPKLPVSDYLNLENRFKMLIKSRPEDAKQLFRQAQVNVDARWRLYQRLAKSESKENDKRHGAPAKVG
jgi:pyruvate/2-oxoacid:ferredoxin oxidoreductase beta subunit